LAQVAQWLGSTEKPGPRAQRTLSSPATMAPKAAAAAVTPDPKAKAKAKAEPKKKKQQGEKEEQERVPPPDKEALNEKVAKVNEEIEKLNKEQSKLTEKINERSSGKTEFFAQKAEIRSQLDELSAKMNELQARKDEINKAVGDKREEGREMRTQLNKMKKSIGYSSETEIDERIATIEFKLWTDTMTLKDEKKYLAEIQELKRNRPKVSQVHKMEEGLQTFADGLSMKDQISAINEEMAKYREQKRGVSQQLTELMEGRKEQLGDLPDLIAKRDEFGKEIAAKIKERNQLRDEFRAAEQEYYAHQAELRRQRLEKQREERMKWQEEMDQRRKLQKAEKLDEQPYVAEMTLIEQTISFCKNLTQSKGTEQKEQQPEKNLDVFEGAEVLLKKEDRDEFYFAPTKGAKKGKSKQKGGKAEGSSKPIKHNAETFRLFDQLKLDAPITTDDIPATLEKLEAQLEEYKAKVKKWEETRDEMKRKILEGLDEEVKPAKTEEEKPAEEEAPAAKGDDQGEEKQEEEKGED